MTRIIAGLGQALWLIHGAARGLWQDLIDRDDLAERRLAAAFTTYVWRPLPVLAVLALLIGLLAGTAAAHILAVYHVELAIEPPLMRLLFGDVLPLMLGLFASGRVAVELSARIGATALANELDALEVLGHDPVRYLLAPALAGVVAAVPVQLLVAALAATAGVGWAIDRSGATSWPAFLGLALGDASWRALAGGAVRALSYALIAFGAGAAVGAGGARDADAIAARATTAFTLGLLAIFAAAVLWAVLG